MCSTSLVIGVCRCCWHYIRSSSVRTALRALPALYLERHTTNVAKGRILVMMVGYSLSGKTTFVDNHPALQIAFSLDTRAIHDMLNDAFSFLRDDRSVHGRAYWERQLWTRYLRRRILASAFERGYVIVSDSCNLKRSWRQRLVLLARSHQYRTAIIWVRHPAFERVLRAARELDENLMSKGARPTWEALVRRQFTDFEPPTDDEADALYVYDPRVCRPHEVLIDALCQS